jgi:hypothetical protein
MKKDFVVRLFFVLVVVIICGLVGMVIGAYLGGNYATSFQFNSVRGYEATGQVGFIVGAALGIFITLKRIKSK